MPTLEYNPERKELLKEISETLKEIGQAGHIVKYYWKIGRLAEQLIIQTLGEENCVFPIDIEALVKEFGIEVEDEFMDKFQNTNVRALNRKIGQLVIRKDSYTGEKSVIIHIDNKVPPSSRRYAIANEFVHYLLHYDEDRYYENYFIMPICPVKMEEIAADIFSVFLLIPMRQFVVEFAQYVEYRVNTQKVPISTEEWMRYLSERAVLSDYYVAYGYQYLRGIGYWVYQAYNAAEEQMKEIAMDEEEKKEIIEWMDGYYTKERSQWIFQA